MKSRLVSSNSRGLSLARAQVFCVRNWRYFKRGLFIYFVVNTWNVLPVMPENWFVKGKVHSCFVICLLMVTTYSNNEAGDISSDMNRKLQDVWKTIYWFLFVCWRHKCSRCCKWLMESYINKLNTWSYSGGFNTYTVEPRPGTSITRTQITRIPR